jgi:periplasmic protein TonB
MSVTVSILSDTTRTAMTAGQPTPVPPAPEGPVTPVPAPSTDWLGGASIFDRKDDRKMGRAMSVSFIAHGILALALLFGFVQATQHMAEPDPDPPKVVYLEAPGPGGGGGGSPAPAPKKELSIPKHDVTPPPIPVPTPVPVAPPPPTLTAPVITSTADVMQASGMNAVSLASYGGGGTGTGIGSGKGNGYGPGEGGGTGGGVYAPGNGVTNPSPLHEQQPGYTSDAMRAKIQGEVWLKVVVKENGTVGDVQIVKSLDDKFGLDEEAKKAAKLWLFRPGMKDGKAVPVYATLILTFRLH